MTPSQPSVQPRTRATLQVVVVVGVLIVMLYGVFARAIFPTADELFDRPLGLGTSADDEGWLHGAYVLAAFGHFLPNDSWHTQAVEPVPNALTYLSFRLVGISLAAMRVLPITLGIATVIALCALMWSAFGRRAAAITAALFAPLVPLIGFARVAMAESFVVFFFALLCLCAPRWRGHVVGAALLGLLAVVAFCTKSSATTWLIPFGLVVCADMIVRARRGTRAAYGELLGFLAASAVGIGAWALWLLHDTAGLHLFHFFATLRTNAGLAGRVTNLALLPSGWQDDTFPLAPYFLLAAATGAGYLIVRRPAPSEPRPNQPTTTAHFVDMLIWGTLVGGIAMQILLGADVSGRRVLYLWLPLGLVAARGLDLMLADAVAPSMLVFQLTRWRSIALALVLLFLAKALTFSALQSTDLPVPGLFPHATIFPSYAARHDWATSPVVNGLLVLAVCVVVAIVGLLTRRHGPRRHPALRTCALVALPSLLALHIADQCVIAMPILTHPFFTYVAAAQRMATLFRPGDVVLGNGAVDLEWAGRFYPLYYYPGVGIGYIGRQKALPGIIARHHVTYLVIPDRAGIAPARKRFEWSSYAWTPGTSAANMGPVLPTITRFNWVVASWRGRERLSSNWSWMILAKRPRTAPPTTRPRGTATPAPGSRRRSHRPGPTS